MLLDRLRTFEPWLALAYAVSLPLSLTASWVILIAGLVIWALLSLSHWRQSGLSACAQMPPLALPLAALAGAATISGAAAGGVSEALASLSSLRALLTYFWSYHVFAANRRALSWCLLALLTTSAVAGIWGTIQQVFDIHPGTFKYLQGTGFHGGPMQFAGQMQILALLATGCLVTGGYKQMPLGKDSQALMVVLTLANWLGVIFAGERSAWLGAIAGSLVLAACVSFRQLAASLLIVSAVATAGYFFVPLVRVRVDAFTSGTKDVSVSVRFRLWDKALELWRQSPVVGVGWRKFPHLDIKEAIVPGVSRDINHAHSNYFQILATSGLVGLAAYLWLVAACLITATRAYFRARSHGRMDEAGIALGVLSATAALAVAGLFEYNFGTAQVRLLHWFALGMLNPKD